MVITCMYMYISIFVCQCSNNSKGVYCRELIDPFESNSCHNNGQCQRDKDNCKWHSNLNHIGKSCEIYQTSCLAQPCQNNERCFDRNNTNECQCSFNYDGKYGAKSIDLC